MRCSGGESREELLLADGADPARDALAARLVAEELGDPAERIDHVGGLVEGHDDAGAEGRADRARRLEGQRRVERVRADEDARRAAEQHGLEIAAAGDAAGELEQLPQRRPELDLVDAGSGDVAADAEELRARRALRADRPVGVGAAVVGEDEQDVDERLDVVDRGRLAEQADLDRERRLVAGLATLALDRFEQRGFLAADVGACAASELDLEIAE